MILFRLLGGLFLVLGLIGIVLPVWPTTIFWIFAAICFGRSSPMAQAWIYRQPGIGHIVESFVEHGILSRRSKLAASFGMGLFGGLGLWFSRESALIASLLFGFLTLGLIYVWSRPVRKTN